ncbi:MAG: dihydroneopterin aldolase [Bacteroides sp.]
MTQYILLQNLHCHAYHGVAPQEQLVGNDFMINLRLTTDFSQAMQSDNVNDTVSYADVFMAVREEMNIPSKLLEHVAGRITTRLYHDFPSISAIELTLLKRNPPMNADIDAAGVELHTTRTDIIVQK